mmetsp:Transcript_10870/g.24089  ORF Transcript_10870/g.24089 Transcript_10870/m.24089 type:complete len:237 (+) Transcript_10870:1742-2452(+)
MVGGTSYGRQGLRGSGAGSTAGGDVLAARPLLHPLPAEAVPRTHQPRSAHAAQTTPLRYPLQTTGADKLPHRRVQTFLQPIRTSGGVCYVRGTCLRSALRCRRGGPGPQPAPPHPADAPGHAAEARHVRDARTHAGTLIQGPADRGFAGQPPGAERLPPRVREVLRTRRALPRSLPHPPTRLAQSRRSTGQGVKNMDSGAYRGDPRPPGAAAENAEGLFLCRCDGLPAGTHHGAGG